MSETNGSGESFKEKFDRLEASHVKLMTDHEVFRAEQDQLWKAHDAKMREWDEQHKASLKEADERGRDLDKRIADLVSGIGTFIAESRAARKA